MRTSGELLLDFFLVFYLFLNKKDRQNEEEKPKKEIAMEVD